MITLRRSIATLLALVLLVGSAPGAWAADTPTAPPPPPGSPPAPPAGTPPAAAPSAPAPAAPAPAASDDEQVAPDQPERAAPTPARLSSTAGDVSFWRPGGDDRAPAQVNTPLAPGDQLYTGNRAILGIQLRSRGCVRAWGDSQRGRQTHGPPCRRLKAAAGHGSADLPRPGPGPSAEVDTPAAAFTITHTGYERVDTARDS